MTGTVYSGKKIDMCSVSIILYTMSPKPGSELPAYGHGVLGRGSMGLVLYIIILYIMVIILYTLIR